ncbi:MAG: LUD domain-containing protein [Pirellulales bacterium]
MTSRDEVLKSIRARRVPAMALPALQHDWVRYADAFAQFKSVVEAAGARCDRVATPRDIAPLLATFGEFQAATRTVSQVAGVAGTVALDDVDDPHDLETIDWAIMPGEFGVAENGAIWVTDERVKQRAIYFIVQHLALVLPANQIVHTMHAAYERIQPGKSSLGLFIAGPSKTADIEQLLVIGAHGPRSLTVIAVGPTV